MTGLSDREAAPKEVFVTHARCLPTPEDRAIFKRNFDRMWRWCADLPPGEAMRVLHRWTGDYLIR